MGGVGGRGGGGTVAAVGRRVRRRRDGGERAAPEVLGREQDAGLVFGDALSKGAAVTWKKYLGGEEKETP